ncbi:PAS domain S-box protein [Chitiniphilus purpureus]|uniref:PAS domain S-box protein n=1 Tax=Chitiniphilus purpureus TaxID=2981137 RepID=A0ABY6DJF7_9NEIS|nr:PAS domain S-box protein [Chitiniphilus sp. CD1]UXY14177.1 PAS domain S-box protein [Chitiniphilus sp. CD1]
MPISTESAPPAPSFDNGHLAQLLAALPVGVAIFDRTLRYRHINAVLAASNGLPAADHLGRTVIEALPMLAGTVEPLLRQVLQTGQALTDLAINGKSSTGELRHWLADYMPLYDATGATDGVLAIVRDITTEHGARGLARAGEERLRRVLDQLLAFVAVLLPDGVLVEANRAPLELAGLTLDDVLGRKYWECGWWNYDPAVQALIQQAVQDAAAGTVSHFEVQMRARDDRLVLIEFMIAPLRDEHGAVTHLIPSGIDISQRKASEEALRYSEQRFRQVVENAPDGLTMVDERGDILLVNAGIERMFGYRREELAGRNVVTLMPERYRAAHPALMAGFMHAPSARDMAGRRELYARRKDGSEFPVEIGLNPVPSSEGMRVLATIVDVTRRKADQAALERALTEKTVLLKEVHHRVKNNLQVISSLLNLQARGAGEEARHALAESQNRVKAMALIHQLLYERNDFSQVDIGIYLQRLCRLLQDAQPRTGVPVTLRLEIDGPVALDLQRAVPCGLLINELVTNAFKHAFPEQRGGTILVTLCKNANGAAVLRVEDDGVGLPPGAEQGIGSLGFQLIPLLVEQLGGSMDIERDHGTRFAITFTPETEVA